MTYTEYTVLIEPEGNASFFLHRDNHPLFDQKAATIIRASNVRFDNDKKVWHVWECLPDGSEVKMSQGFTLRSKAIAYEIEVLEKKMAEEENYVQNLFPIKPSSPSITEKFKNANWLL